MRWFFTVMVCFIMLSACGQRKFSGKFSNGFTSTTLSFSVSKDGQWLTDLVFDGYWRCGGSTEKIKAGPEKRIPIKNGEFHAVVTDPDSGGSSAFRFAVDGAVKGNLANGTFRMSIVALSCDTHLLKWTAAAK